MVIINDLELPMLSYYVIYFEKLRKIMQRTEKEALSLDVNVWSIMHRKLATSGLNRGGININENSLQVD